MDEGASGVLAAAALAALRQVPGLSGEFDGAPIAAADAHAVVEPGPETDWGHKNGAGAEVRFAVVIVCGGEAAGRLRGLMTAVRSAVGALAPDLDGWRLVSLVMVRARIIRGKGPRWTGSIEYRARLLAA